MAFEQPLDSFGLPEHVYNILTEAEYLTVGELLLAVKTRPDQVFGLPGIGPKAMQAINKAVSEVSFEKMEAAPVVEEVPAPAGVEVVETPVEIPAEVVAEVAEVAAPEIAPSPETGTAEVSTPATGTVEEPAQEATFEELFKLRPETFRPGTEEDDLKQDKKGKKGKKSVVYQYDELRGEVVIHKKHKRGTDDWSDE